MELQTIITLSLKLSKAMIPMNSRQKCKKIQPIRFVTKLLSERNKKSVIQKTVNQKCKEE